MRARRERRPGPGPLIVLALVTSISRANAQYPLCPPNMIPWPPPTYPPSAVSPGTSPAQPGTPQPGQAAPGSAAESPAESAPSGSVGGEFAAVSETGYIDGAIVLNQFRLRYDSAYNNNRPDRAEFFYGKCGCFRLNGQDPRAPGPALLETRVDYQELRPYLEYAFTKRFSGFIEAPVRFINPEQNANAAGFGNLQAGFKYAMVADPDRYLTFQFTTAAPTGDADRGLGNGLTSVEPGILWYQRLTDRLVFESELRDWIPIGGTNYQGNVLRSGAGLSYELLANADRSVRLVPVAEFVSWVVLSGKSSGPQGQVQDAAGDTIVNMKLGSRLDFGTRGSLYVGYGRALTGEVWYKDMFRMEARFPF
jgi:hypothetical protein